MKAETGSLLSGDLGSTTGCHGVCGNAFGSFLQLWGNTSTCKST